MNNKISLALACSILLMTNNAYALNGDSVMSPSGAVSSNVIQDQTGNLSAPVISSVNLDEYRYGTCPVGFAYGGISIFPSEVRSLITYYLNGQQTGQSASAWRDTDLDCTKTEYQTLACPAGYTGEQFQSRLVSTKDGGALEYGSWNTYQNSCTVAGCAEQYIKLSGIGSSGYTLPAASDGSTVTKSRGGCGEGNATITPGYDTYQCRTGAWVRIGGMPNSCNNDNGNG